MADNTEELVYRINLDVASAFANIQKFKQELNLATQEMVKLRETEDKRGSSTNNYYDKMKTNTSSLTQMLREVRKGIDLVTRGYEVMDGEGKKALNIQELRRYEKALEDLQKQIKASSLNNIEKSMAQMQEKALRENQAVNKLIKDLDRLQATYRRTYEESKKMASSSYYNRQGRELDKIEQLSQYGIKRNPVYVGSYGDYRKPFDEADLRRAKQREHIEANIAASQQARKAHTDALISGAKKQEQAERNIRKIIAEQNIALARGQQLQEANFNASRKRYQQELQTYRNNGGKRNFSEPFAQFGNSHEQNIAAVINNAKSWDTTRISSFTNEINRLKTAQEGLYQAWKVNPTNANLLLFAQTKNRVAELEREYAKYQKRIELTGSAYDHFMMKARSHLAWIASGTAIAAIGALPITVINAVQQIDKDLASIEQVIPTIEPEFEKLGNTIQAVAGSEKKAYDEAKKLIDIAKAYGDSVHNVMEGARLLGRMYGQGENGVINTNLMTQQAAKMATADAFSMADAVRGLESAMAQWNLQSEDTNTLLVNSSRILDTWTAAAHRGAASGQDIAQGIEVAGSAAAQAGLSFEFFTSLLETGVRQTGRSGNEIGQAIKSMMVSMQSNKSIKALQDFGIEVYKIGEDGTKSMRSMEEIILDTSFALQNTTQDTQKLLMTLSGGRRKLAA